MSTAPYDKRFDDVSAEPPKRSELTTPQVSQRFIERMEHELISNQHKGDWSGWRPSAMQIVGELNHHLGKLALALDEAAQDGVHEYKARCRGSISEYAADLANLAMKADEMFGLAGWCDLLDDSPSRKGGT